METDALQVESALHSLNHHLAVLCGLIHELKELLLDDFMSSKVDHVPRKCNKVAHELARISALYQIGHAFLSHDVPDCILGSGQRFS